MKPAVGEMAPDFTAKVVEGSEKGRSVSLSELRGGKVVLVFYPRDSTPGCTLQACALRDGWEELKGKARIFGVSADSAASHLKFIAKRKLPYPLIVDEDLRVVQAYGVWVQKSFMGKKFMGIERSSFVIDEEGRVAAVLEKVQPLKHLDLLRKALA